MPNTEKQFIGVLAAEVNSIEQRQIVKGIGARAQQLGKKTIIFSNLYNPYDFDDALACENDIYQLIFSSALCGLILIEESFLNEKLRKIVCDLLRQRQDIPVIAIGIYVKALDFPNVHFINADDAEDMAQIVQHLVQQHQLTKIDILTGFAGNDASERRVQGYRCVLEENGIPFAPERVHYGDFWFTSGETLAKQYISGEFPLPEAVVCANDYMAYGLLDTFLQNGIRVPEDILVIGYEYIHERVYHAPLLSTYQRERFKLGEKAVSMLHTLVCGEELPAFHPPEGIWIPGYSCGCGPDADQLHAELEDMRTKQQYEKWNVLGTMEQQLTLCSNLDEFIEALSKHHFWVRWVQNMYLCLFENWYDTSAEVPSNMLTCRSVMPWNHTQPPIVCDRYDFGALYANAPEAALHYYLPLFFEKHFFGYYVLEYHAPDTYDDVFRNWMKSISIGLTFLCMKNDIRYLLQCQNLSEQQDVLTELYNQRGTEQALAARLASAEQPLYAVVLKISLPETGIQQAHNELLQKTAQILRRVGTQHSICGRTGPQTFVCIDFPCTSETGCEQMREKLFAILLHETELIQTYGMESITSSAALFQPDTTPAACLRRLSEEIDVQTANQARQKQAAHAGTLFQVRNRLYQTRTLSADAVCREYAFSPGYFRQIYKECFGVSFHQDAINARILRAVFLLSTTVMSISAVAENCGYEDYNYFLRQFQKVTGLTPGQFRREV